MLPRRMASVSTGAFVSWYRPTGTRRAELQVPGLRLGLTDRLEWTDLTSLTYAFLDDAPTSTRPAPLSLALQVGAPFGFSSIEGFIVVPFVSLEALRHVSNVWAFWLSAEAFVRWVTSPLEDQRFNSALIPTRGRWGGLDVSAGARRQLTERVGLFFSGGVGQLQDCFGVVCQQTSRDGRVTLGLSFRPWYWVTLYLSSSLGERYRYRQAPAQPDPTDPLVPTPRSVHWTTAAASAAFYW